jgi:hypothetical protein
MSFPSDTVPDGTVAAPHHLYIGIIIAAFGFALVWRLYPRTGALLTLSGLLIALDDAIDHAFGITTPGELIGRFIIAPLVRLLESL